MKGDLWGLFLVSDGGPMRESVLSSHGLLACTPNPCPLHAPSAHHMRSWRLHWRQDRMLMERVCPEHGTGHPDPDHLSYLERTRGTQARLTEGIHGCCGCCRPSEESTDE